MVHSPFSFGFSRCSRACECNHKGPRLTHHCHFLYEVRKRTMRSVATTREHFINS
ncbi:uncharacterized protein BT62DRAFT_649741 [Guyanagaster necrorhizus]|uniref:Uncharacterized protein n=1 Tax=Guyanagaster necrorhizus TaxID=856835 RepID=A0A9P7VFY4_9AGAR|nr:uncharacterized protein BT62DRAFT_649735 [Guyanagaster necrorhizus MCA 3950]XP_043033489.1 uncharacterized protein BT62DRAFT_649741 [Guyanagaster necrorhizus MCA 3950]KAG7439987.1 hypothetical protein BT62DRAFT_649735 [Guyanagaster necrorhizus MCA 3950]KAG7439989.1 hypothetical protein BT62DRAFT_649741 [Guyanagaster necrorhizus MCA 3950]